MKSVNVILVFLFSCLLFASCNKDKHDIVGKWKLVTVEYMDTANMVMVDGYYWGSEMDYSENNLIYDFQRNNKLTITGSMSGELQNNKYPYRYKKVSPSPAIPLYPNPNLQIGEENYYCSVYSETETMTIRSDGRGKGIGIDEIDLTILKQDNVVIRKKIFNKIK